MRVTHFVGRHLLVDGFTEAPSLLDSEDWIKQWMLGLVDVLDMDLLVEPMVKRVDLMPHNVELDTDDGGISGMCMITTSHISIHTWPLQNFVSIDIFSCKDFEAQAAIDYTTRHFKLDSINCKNVERFAPKKE